MKALRNRKTRVRNKLKSKSIRPRLSVFVSNTHIYAQIIDDAKGMTLVSARDTDAGTAGKSTQIAKGVGEALAKKAKEKGVTEVKFDRGDRKYHGRIKALAEGAREGGLSF
jgi:large subunit ribosomal protein L18